MLPIQLALGICFRLHRLHRSSESGCDGRHGREDPLHFPAAEQHPRTASSSREELLLLLIHRGGDGYKLLGRRRPLTLGSISELEIVTCSQVSETYLLTR